MPVTVKATFIFSNLHISRAHYYSFHITQAIFASLVTSVVAER